MDTLPKDSGNDLSSFSGSYPTASGQPKTPPPPAPAVAPTNPPAPFVTEPVNQAPVIGDANNPFAQAAAPAPTATAPPSAPAAPTQPPATSVMPETPPPQPPPNTGTPFVMQAQTSTPSSPKGGGGLVKRILGILLLFIIVGGVGFAAFRFISGFIAQNQPITLTYWGLWEDDTIMAPVLAEYKKTHPKVEIVYTKQSPRQYRERLQAAIARGEGPDLFRFHASWVPMLKNDLAPAASTGYTAQEFQQTFYPVAYSDLVIGGKVLGAPLMIDGLGLYYNEDLLRAAGVAPPSSWESFREAALALTVKDNKGKIVTSGAALGTAVNVEHFSDIVALMMLQNGADLKNPVTKEATDALSFYRLFAESPGNVWDETLDNSILAFASGKVAMIFAPSWQAHEIKQVNPEIKFQVLPVPQLPGSSVAWASYWAEGVASTSKHPQEAWEFLKFLSSKESLLSLYTEASKTRLFGEPYSRVDLAQTLINDPFVGAYIKQAPTAKSFFLSSRTFDNGINDRMIKYVEDGINSLGKGVSMDAVLDTVSKGFAQVLTNFGASAAR